MLVCDLENDVQLYAYITKLHFQLLLINCKQRVFVHHIVSVLSSENRLLLGRGQKTKGSSCTTEYIFQVVCVYNHSCRDLRF